MQKTYKSTENPGTLVLIWEYSTRAIQWVPTWQVLDGFQKIFASLCLEEIGLSIGRVNTHSGQELPNNIGKIPES